MSLSTEEIRRLDRRYVWHPCTQEKDHETLPPIPIARGEGPYLIDTDGNRYIDGVSSWWVNLFGHNNPRLNRALQEQSGRIAHHIFAGFTHEPAVLLAEQLAALTPGDLSRTFFADNGSSAVEAALKMSFQYWQQTGKPVKTRFVSLTDAYHGETVGALSVSGCDLYKKVYQGMLLTELQATGPDCYRCPYGETRDTCNAQCIASLEEIIAEHHKELAAVIIEPLIQCAAGMKIYSPIYLKRLREICDRYQIHYIADEIAVGFGRTGKLFANEHAGVSPDLLCLSKGITGGYMPLSVVVTTDEIYQAFYDDYATLKAFLHSHSYSGNPLACALAVETLKIFAEEKVLQGIPQRRERIKAGLQHLIDHPNVGEIRDCGLVFAIELVADKSQKTPFPWQERIGYQLFQDALKQGALLRPLGNVLYFMPPLTTPLEVLDDLCRIASQSILNRFPR